MKEKEDKKQPHSKVLGKIMMTVSEIMLLVAKCIGNQSPRMFFADVIMELEKEEGKILEVI